MEITHIVDRHWFERLLEITPGLVTLLVLIAPVILSLTAPLVLAYFIIAFDLFWFIKAFRLSYFLLTGFRKMRANAQIDWEERLNDLADLDATLDKLERQIDYLVDKYPRATKRFPRDPKSVVAHIKYLRLRKQFDEFKLLQDKRTTLIYPKDIYNVVIIPTYNESRAILEPSIQALTKVKYPLKQLMVIIAYEERGGEAVEENANNLIAQYGPQFAFAAAIKHPDGLPGEGKVKGANSSYACREVAKHIEEQEIDPERVIVTTLDADHRVSEQYFANLTYLYITDVNRTRRSYQPLAIFNNNIWDAPAPMRVIAAGNSFWNIVESMRPYRLRNFAAHAQGLQTLIDTDYWHLTSIVEDGHQFWRTYFTYDGDHKVIPVMSPIYQDAVLADSYSGTIKAQYLQLRRWAWGVSDFPYVVRNSIKNKNIPWGEKLTQIGRLFEGHLSWATVPFIVSFGASLPLFLNASFKQHSLLAYQLPVYVSRINAITIVALLVNIYISLRFLPPKPARYRQSRSIAMVVQWFLFPITIAFGSVAALDAQMRLMFGRYLDWQVTDKATKDTESDYIVEEIT